MANNVTLKIDGVSMGEIIGLGDIPTWTIRGAVVPGKKPIANSKKTAVNVKEFGSDMIIADIDIDNATYAYRIEIMQRLQELKELYKGEHVTVEFSQTCASGIKTLTFDDCLCVDIDVKKITDGAGGTFTFKFIYGNTNMKIEQIKNGNFLIPDGTDATMPKYWEGAVAGGEAISKRIINKNGVFNHLLYADGSNGAEVHTFVRSKINATTDDIAILNVELERTEIFNDFVGTKYTTVEAGSFVPGVVYTILSTGAVIDLTTIGAPNNTIGSFFAATSVGSETTAYLSELTKAINCLKDSTYEIRFVGTTDWTVMGASSNTVGVIFKANGKHNVDPSGLCVKYEKCNTWNLPIGSWVMIEKVGTTDWITMGSPNKLIGTVFLRTSDLPHKGTGRGSHIRLPTQVNIGTYYETIGFGTADVTDFTTIGSADNNIGTEFTATDVGTGSGTASYISDHVWDVTEDPDDELKVVLAIYWDVGIISQNSFILTKNTKQKIFTVAWELNSGYYYGCLINLYNNQTGAILIKKVWLETRRADECY